MGREQRGTGDVIIITKRTRVTLTTCNNSHDPYINYKAEPAQPLEKLSSELRRCAKNTQSPSARSNQVTTYICRAEISDTFIAS